MQLTWGLHGETDSDPAQALGLSEGDVDELAQALPRGSRVSIRRGSIGKGAAGAGASLVFEVAERVMTDLAGLLGVGYALRDVVRRMKERGHGAATADAEAIGALAAAEAGVETLAGARFVGVVPITASVFPGTAQPGEGTDARDIWAACFELPESGHGLVVFMSPTGLCLGVVTVPAEFGLLPDGQWGLRDASMIAQHWRAGTHESGATET